MKKGKWISLLTLCLALSFGAHAQISVGAKAGLNVYDNYQTGTKYFTSSPGVGFHVGAYGDYDLSELLVEKLHGRVEILLSTRGMKLSENTPTGRIDYNRESIYLDIPAYATYTVWDKLDVEAGVVTSLFLDEYRAVNTDQEGFKVPEDNLFRSYERWQFGVMAGASYPFTLFDQNFVGSVRYSMALTPALELTDGARASRDPKYMMLQASIAYKIMDFGKKASE